MDDDDKVFIRPCVAGLGATVPQSMSISIVATSFWLAASPLDLVMSAAAWWQHLGKQQ